MPYCERSALWILAPLLDMIFYRYVRGFFRGYSMMQWYFWPCRVNTGWSLSHSTNCCADSGEWAKPVSLRCNTVSLERRSEKCLLQLFFSNMAQQTSGPSFDSSTPETKTGSVKLEFVDLTRWQKLLHRPPSHRGNGKRRMMYKAMPPSTTTKSRTRPRSRANLGWKSLCTDLVTSHPFTVQSTLNMFGYQL